MFTEGLALNSVLGQRQGLYHPINGVVGDRVCGSHRGGVLCGVQVCGVCVCGVQTGGEGGCEYSQEVLHPKVQPPRPLSPPPEKGWWGGGRQAASSRPLPSRGGATAPKRRIIATGGEIN